MVTSSWLPLREAIRQALRPKPSMFAEQCQQDRRRAEALHQESQRKLYELMRQRGEGMD